VTVDSSELSHTEPTPVEQAATVQPEILHDDIDRSSATEEDLAEIAQHLIDCPDVETLAALRQCWTPEEMNAACKRLSFEKHNQIKTWEIELNQVLKVGDRVIWENCPAHCSNLAPFEIMSIDGDYAKLDLFEKLVPLAELNRA
jgi:hypothetical protein